jgi:hypothetical protein
MPQDYWVDNKEGFSVPNGTKLFGIRSDNKMFIGIGGRKEYDNVSVSNFSATNIMVYDLYGSIFKNLGSFSDVQGVSFDLQNNTYVLDGSIVSKYDINLNKINSFDTHVSSSIPAFNTYFTFSKRIAVDNLNNIYVASSSNSKVVAFDNNGNKIGDYGTKGNLFGQFQIGPLSIAIGPDGIIQLLDTDGSYNYSIHSLSYKLEYLSKKYIGSISNPGAFTISYDGLNAFTNHNTIQGNGGAYDQGWNFYVLANSRIDKYTRLYYGKNVGLSNVPPPQPVILQQSQRVGTTYLDIDYKVIAATNTPLKVGMLAFVNGQIGRAHV